MALTLMACAVGGGLTAAAGASSAETDPGARAATAEGECNWMGQVILVGFGFAPKYTVDAEGQQWQVKGHELLFSLLGNQYGGDGTKGTFDLPDLRGKAPRGLRYVLCTQSANYPSRNGTDGPTCNYLAEVVLVAFPYAAVKTKTARGQLLSFAHDEELYDVLGNTFGGDGRKGTFALPNLAGKAPGKLRYLICTAGENPHDFPEPCNWAGQIILSAFSSPLPEILPAHGQLVSVLNHSELHDLYGNRFGNGTSTSFRVPNLIGKAPPDLHYGVCSTGFLPSRS